MRWIGLVLVAAAAGCATAQPFVVSNQQRVRFEQVVNEAEAAATANGPARAVELVAEARSDFEYAQHLPKYPERARALVAKAQHEADTALWMTREAHRQAMVPGRGAATAAAF
jgi:hypothetical protein